MKQLVMKEIQSLKESSDNIETLISKKKYTEAEQLLAIFNEEDKTEKYYELLSTVLIKTRRYKEAIEILKVGLESFLNSKILYQKLYEAYWEEKDYENAILALAKLVRRSFNEDERLKETERLKKLIPLLYDLIGKNATNKVVSEATLILGEGDERAYPIDKEGESWVKRCLIDSKNNKYLVNIYKGYTALDLNLSVRYYLKTETILGNHHRYIRLKLDKDSYLPISGDFEKDFLEITDPNNNKVSINANHFQSHRINYLNLSAGEYRIKSKKEFFIGKPIEQEEKEKNKIVIILYIDGLSQLFLEKHGLENLMPNTARYFQNGYWNQNCYTTSDWTYPSVASIYTGQLALRHKVYHPNVNLAINKRGEMFTTKFKEHGLFTTQLNNNWRITPSSGYIEDFDRTVYQNFRGGFAVAEVLGEAMEHLAAFPKKDHYLWVGIEDLHDIADGFNQDLYQQTHLTLEERAMNEMAEISVNAEFSNDKLVKYKNQLKRIDMYLESFYHFLNTNYVNDDVYVAIISDHGQGYIENNGVFLSEGRRRVPFIFKGPNVPNKVSHELMSITDYFPTILTAIGADSQMATSYDATILKDFGGAGREKAITETLHPENPYRIAITEGNFIFRLSTVEKARGDGLINLEQVEVELLDKETEQDVSDEYPEKLQEYIDFVVNRAKHFQYM